MSCGHWARRWPVCPHRKQVGWLSYIGCPFSRAGAVVTTGAGSGYARPQEGGVGGTPPVLGCTASRGGLAVYASRLVYELPQVRGHANYCRWRSANFLKFVGTYK